MKLSIRRIQVIVIITILFSNISNAQITKNNELYQTLKVKDSLFFEGFNTCNLAMIEELLHEKFEFYHDKDGLTSSKDVFISNLKKNLCSSGKNITKRVLIKGSLKVFPLYNNKKLYAEIQSGRHSFGSTIARFTNLFILDNGNWMPTRIMSYDHKRNTAPIVSVEKFHKLSPSEMSIYLGDYEFSPEFTLSIIKDGDTMYGDAQGQKVEIKYYGNHKFLDSKETMKLNFILNDQGSVTGLKMISRDREMVAKKII
jgi:hypothetical protein